MSDLMFCTEAEVKDVLLTLAKETDEAPFVFVAFREQKSRSLQRQVTFVIQTREGNEELVNKLVKIRVDNEDSPIRFIKSDMNVQNGLFEIDYLFVAVTISPKLI